MPFYFKVYAKSDCPYCVVVLNHMKLHGFDHALILVDKAPDFYHHLKAKYEHYTVPMVVKCSKTDPDSQPEFIGGCDDFEKWLESEGYQC